MTKWEYCSLSWITGLVDEAQKLSLKGLGFSDAIFDPPEAVELLKQQGIYAGMKNLDVQNVPLSGEQRLALVQGMADKLFEASGSWGFLWSYKVDGSDQRQLVENLGRTIAQLGLDGWEISGYEYHVQERTRESLYLFKRPLDNP